MFARLLIVVCAATLMFGACSVAQEKEQSSEVEALATATLDASRQGDWTVYVGNMHPASVEEFKSILWPVFEVAAFRDTAFAGLASNFFGLEFNEGGIVDKPAGDFMTVFMDSVMNLLPSMEESYKNSQFTTLGSVVEGDSMVHVLYRVNTAFAPGPQAERVSLENVEVSSWQKTDAGWKMLLPEQLKGMAQRISQLIQTGR